jgi:nucleotide-binding universal stress UspA family protein
MYKRILLPVDGSPCSDVALDHGLNLAKTLSAKITLLHSVENPIHVYAVPETLIYNQELYEALKKSGHEVLANAKAKADALGVQTETKFIEDTAPLEAILGSLETCDLVVMGTHGRRGFDRWMFGSVAEGVLRHANKPCLMIRHPDDKK